MMSLPGFSCEKSRQFVVGDPADSKTTIGPMASAEQRDRVEHYIESGIKEGATHTSGRSRGRTLPPLDKGFYVSPAVFVNVTQEMKIAREEIFGPVACILKFSSDEEVLEKPTTVLMAFAHLSGRGTPRRVSSWPIGCGQGPSG